MIISDKHLFMTAGEEMRTLLSPLGLYGIHYFTYNKNYINGKRIRLTTHVAHLKGFLEQGHYKTGNIDAHPSLYLNQVALYSTLKNQALVEWLREDFNVDNGIYIIRKSLDYTEFFGFGTPRNQTSMVNFYLSNIDLLQNFCDYFKEKGAVLIQQAEKNVLIHDYHEQAIQTYAAEEVMHYLLFNQQRLTQRQQDIILLLLQGLRAKEIAKALAISPRTVEDYLSQLKIKFKVRNLIELVVKLAKLY